MSAYLIADIQITDPQPFEAYRRQVPAIIAAYGGRYLVRGGDTRLLEGDELPGRTIVLEFADMDRLNAFYHSPDYQPLKALRMSASTGRLFSVEGG
jgi:uncharacterized protein (DUF1330 family)